MSEDLLLVMLAIVSLACVLLLWRYLAEEPEEDE